MNNRIAFITGATSGIGASFARRFAGDGYDLIITGRRKKKIHSLAKDISEKYNVDVKVIIAELSDRKDVHKIIDIISNNRNIEVLVNNAGYGIDKNFHEGDIRIQEEMVNVHINTPMNFIHAVIPQMIENKKGVIINLSSIASFLPIPTGAIYCGTKVFLNKFSESLSMELNNTGIKVQVLCPGFTRTDFHSKLNMKRSELENKGIIKWMSSDDVVKYSMKCMERNSVVCIPGFWNRFLVNLAKLAPDKLYYKIVTKI